jgi:hypothetical protein
MVDVAAEPGIWLSMAKDGTGSRPGVRADAGKRALFLRRQWRRNGIDLSFLLPETSHNPLAFQWN